MTDKRGLLIHLSKEELAEVLAPHFQEIHDQLSKQQKPQINFDQVVHSAYKRLNYYGKAPFQFREEKSQQKAGLSPCAIAIGTVVGDAFGIVFQFLGINEKETRAATRALLAELGEDTLRGLSAKIHDIANATSIVDKAKEIWGLISEVKNAVGFKGIVKALKDSMHWYDWVITGVTAVAQLTAWFATDGVAFIAELALEGAYVAQLVEDAVNAVDTCG
ncbi:hypothetical protein WL35_06780 [Burkholderia ubonensis]|uniref:hypothetical protein n=1 Tax=Burkholderia ubonensis TaxID=101571 RepID=UPI00075CD3BA|nr:hypothetical protein [Burkholderia ubonensis]KVU30239.1 hypothetical protein WK66_06380 [Burkholderia ubonensis]KWB49508.1 hypothetical protein WL35_06780 [Burkholderia ubonensis]KWK77436.1 hypothetical protein WM15_27975 [Burkholderia ubonensis]